VVAALALREALAKASAIKKENAEPHIMLSRTMLLLTVVIDRYTEDPGNGNAFAQEYENPWSQTLLHTESPEEGGCLGLGGSTEGTPSAAPDPATLVARTRHRAVWMIDRDVVAAEQLACEFVERIASVMRWKWANIHLASSFDPLPPQKLDSVTKAIMNAADAELGMQVFRDLILSFGLPKRVVGLRHTLLLSRETSGIATRNYSTLVAHAHAAGLRGPAGVWEHGVSHSAYNLVVDAIGVDGQNADEQRPFFLDASEEARIKRASLVEDTQEMLDASKGGSRTERMCSLLAGLAMLASPNANEARKGFAFDSRVSLPFLCLPRPRGAPLLELHTNGEWTLVAPDEATGGPKLITRGRDVDGLQRCACLMVAMGLVR